MAQPTFEQFYSAIAEQESGGNYGAVGVWVNGDRAYGKYQIMGANIPGWTKTYLGYSMTPQQFLKDSAAQEKVAKGRLKSYYKKYGARGAASAWYSGNASLHNSTKPQPGGPSIKGYVDSVIGKAMKYPTSGGGVPSGSTSGGSAPVVPKLSRTELAEQYGFTAAFLKSNKEIGKLFDSMVSGGWSKDKFQAKLRNTKWWKSKPEKERQYLIQKFTDPATAKQELWQAQVKIAQMAKQMGAPGDGKLMASYAYKMVAQGWTEAQIRYSLGAKIKAGPQGPGGEAGEAWDEFHAYAYSMGVNVSPAWAQAQVRQIARGVGTMQDAKNKIDSLAKAKFPQWAKQIDGGQNVMDIASPYLQSMATVLELPQGSIDLFDPTIKSTLNWTNPKTLTKEAKPLWQFENELRADPRWKKTQNAQDSIMTVAHQVLADFGVKY